MYYYSTMRLILIYRPSEGGTLSLPRHCSKCAARTQSCVSQFFVKTNFCPQRDSNLGPLAQQASVLPLDHLDLYNQYHVAVYLQFIFKLLCMSPHYAPTVLQFSI